VGIAWSGTLSSSNPVLFFSNCVPKGLAVSCRQSASKGLDAMAKGSIQLHLKGWVVRLHTQLASSRVDQQTGDNYDVVTEDEECMSS
jgi:hypothetical protein